MIYGLSIENDFISNCFPSLQRPDNKQTFVTSWVKNYNSVAEDMRQDVEMKAELHQTIEVSCYLIWYN